MHGGWGEDRERVIDSTPLRGGTGRAPARRRRGDTRRTVGTVEETHMSSEVAGEPADAAGPLRVGVVADRSLAQQGAFAGDRRLLNGTPAATDRP